MVRAVAVSTLCFALFLSAGRSVLAADASPVSPEALADGGVAHIAAIGDDGSLLTADGRVIRLAGLRFPGGIAWREAAVSALRTLVLGHDLRLRFDDRRRDRYGRMLAQGITDAGVWLQGELIGHGLAEVESRRGNSSLIGPLLALETTARGRNAGLWSDARFAVASAAEVARDPDGHLDRFGIVEGDVATVSSRSNWTFLNFGADWHTDFTVAVSSRDRRAVRDGGLDLAGLTGKHVRVRGWLRNWNGPLIEVDHAEQIEIIGDATTIAGGSQP
jgi:Staphylococcal nuclease homologue